MPDATSDAVLIATLKLRKQIGNDRETAVKLGLSERAIRFRIATAAARGLTESSTLVSDVDKLRAKVTELETELRQRRGEELEARAIRAAIHGLGDPVANAPAWVIEKPKEPDLPGVPMTMWSDWHYGETVFRDQVNGVNSFNPGVAAERIERLVQKTIMLTTGYTVHPTYPGIVIALGGDMITGDIHEELRETNAVPTQRALLDVEQLILKGLRTMADKFGRVFVPCVVGNHGRNTLKPRAKHRVFTSLEWNLYCHLERALADDKRFTFMVPNSPDAFFRVFNHRFMLTHGDALGVKGGDGIIGALGPIARGTFKTARFTSQIRRSFDTLLIGHWHSYIPRGDAVPVIVNGTLKGYDEFAHTMLRAPYAPPSQALWFVHPVHGITQQWQVFLDDRRHTGREAPWLSIPPKE